MIKTHIMVIFNYNIKDSPISKTMNDMIILSPRLVLFQEKELRCDLHPFTYVIDTKAMKHKHGTIGLLLGKCGIDETYPLTPIIDFLGIQRYIENSEEVWRERGSAGQPIETGNDDTICLLNLMGILYVGFEWRSNCRVLDLNRQTIRASETYKVMYQLPNAVIERREATHGDTPPDGAIQFPGGYSSNDAQHYYIVLMEKVDNGHIHAGYYRSDIGKTYMPQNLDEKTFWFLVAPQYNV